MKKYLSPLLQKIVLLLCALLLCFCNTVPVFSDTINFDLSCQGAILMEATTGTILYEQDADVALRPASVTKIMTILLIFEAIERNQIALTDIVTISAHAAKMGGSQVFLEENEQQTVEDLLKCICIASANDASVAMAEFIAGTETEFVNQMNEKAKTLGMNNTHFVNCCGLDADGHLTSARDVAIMSRELITRFPQVHKYTTTWMDEITHVTSRGSSVFGLTNTNKLISTYPYATGLKTGSTSLAKYSVSATATKDDVTLIAVIMGDVDYKVRFENAKMLLEYGFSNCKIYKDHTPTILPSLSVNKGTQLSVNLCYKETFTFIDTKGSDLSAIKTVLSLPKHLTAPITIETPIGTLDYYLKDEKIGSIPIYPVTSVKRISYSYCIKELFYALLP